MELPEPVLEFLRTHDPPDVVRCFTEGRLRELAALRDPRAVWNRFRDLLREIGHSAGECGSGIW